VKKLALEKQVMFLLSRKNTIEGKNLIKTFEALNYTPQSIRNALTKLKKQSYITSVERGSYSLTANGLAAYNLSSNKENFYHKQWDRRWYLVFMEIPEILRKKRDAFRNKLLGLGFGHLYKSVYVYPWDLTNKVLDFIDLLEIEDYVTITVSQEFLLNKISPEGSPGPNSARAIWDIEELNHYYKEKQIWLEKYKSEFNHLITDPGRDILSIFTHYLSLRELRDDLIERDPMLPPEFLPGSWVGTTVLYTIDYQLELLGNLLSENPDYSAFVSGSD
jgi:phenylacetic acid degradation operon negative regulatory protein